MFSPRRSAARTGAHGILLWFSIMALLPVALIVMNAFKSQVAAQSGKQIPVPLATQLTADADAFEAAIPCP